METEKPIIKTHTISPPGEGEYVYVGWAKQGSSESDAVWRIMRIHTISSVGEGENVSMVFADSNDNYDNVWEDHESLTYE